MMSGMLSGRAIFGNQPNVLFDASNYSKGQNDALAIQKNRLMMDRAQMENTADQAFRAAAPGAIGGDPAALNAAIAADPDRGMALQTQIATLDAGKRKRALESMTLLAQGAASLLNLPDDQAATTYPTLLERFKGMGIDTSALPPAYPGRAAVETFARGLIPVMDQLKLQDERIVPAGGGQSGQTFADRVQDAENNTGNPAARNPRSSAMGNGQFLTSTWMEFIQENPTLFQGMTTEQAMAARAKKEFARQAINWYAQKNTPALTQAGFEPSEANLYLAHRLGPGDGVKVLAAASQNPGMPLSSILSPVVIQANPDLAQQTAGGLIQGYRQRFPAQGGQPQPLVRQGSGMPAQQGLPAGMQWAQDANGQRIAVSVPGVQEAALNLERGKAAIKGENKGTRVLPSPERVKLIDAGQRLSELDRLAGSFADDYGGFGSSLYGDARNTIARNTPGESPRANWWQSYQALKNVVRNELFGAALTATEKAEFEKADITTGMSPATIRANIARQKDILQGAIRRRSRSLAADGYNADAITEATGVSLDAAPAEARPGEGARTVARTGKLPDGRKVIQYSDGTTEVQ